MTKPQDRPDSAPVWEPLSLDLLTEIDALDFAKRRMVCVTCEWAVRKGDECEETKYVRGCIHWKAREEPK